MPNVLILIVCVVPLALSIGLPLLLKPESRVPDYLGFGALGAAVLGYAWATGAWWMLLAALAIGAFAAWLDRTGPEPAPTVPPTDERGWSDRTRSRFRRWRLAHYLSVALILGIVILVATGVRLVYLDQVAGGMLLSVLASHIFRFSFFNAAERDRCARAGVGEAPRPAESGHASPAALG
jgi:hypothetical protein